MEKLDAVRLIVQRNGRRPSNTLESGTASDMGMAEDFLDQEELDIQGRGWHYNTRTNVLIEPVLYSFNNAAWTDSTQTLTQTGAFADATAGQSIEITAGAVAGTYTVDEVVSDNAVTLVEDIGTGIDIASGIAGTAVNNKIVVPEQAIHIDTDQADKGRDFTQRGGRMLDLDNNVDLFENGYRFTYIERLAWGCIPYKFRRYIAMLAALRFSEHFTTDQYGSISKSLKIAREEALAAESKALDVDFLGTPQARRMRGGRGGMGSLDRSEIRYGSYPR